MEATSGWPLSAAATTLLADPKDAGQHSPQARASRSSSLEGSLLLCARPRAAPLPQAGPGRPLAPRCCPAAPATPASRSPGSAAREVSAAAGPLREVVAAAVKERPPARRSAPRSWPCRTSRRAGWSWPRRSSSGPSSRAPHWASSGWPRSTGGPGRVACRPADGDRRAASVLAAAVPALVLMLDPSLLQGDRPGAACRVLCLLSRGATWTPSTAGWTAAAPTAAATAAATDRSALAQALVEVHAHLVRRKDPLLLRLRQRRCRGVLVRQQRLDVLGEGQVEGGVERVDAVLGRCVVGSGAQVGDVRVVGQCDERVPESLGQVDRRAGPRCRAAPRR